jgi:hypothetical protein
VAYRNLPLGSVWGAGTAWIGCSAGAACIMMGCQLCVQIWIRASRHAQVGRLKPPLTVVEGSNAVQLLQEPAQLQVCSFASRHNAEEERRASAMWALQPCCTCTAAGASALTTCTTGLALGTAAAAALPACARFHSSGAVHFDSLVVLQNNETSDFVASFISWEYRAAQ